MIKILLLTTWVVVFITLSIYANGGTFGQKCSTYSGVEFETCLTRLSNGETK